MPSSLGDKPYVLAESGSILRYVEATLRGQHLPAEQPVAKARHEMLAEAATFAMLRWFACAEKEVRSEAWKRLCARDCWPRALSIC